MLGGGNGGGGGLAPAVTRCGESPALALINK